MNEGLRHEEETCSTPVIIIICIYLYGVTEIVLEGLRREGGDLRHSYYISV